MSKLTSLSRRIECTQSYLVSSFQFYLAPALPCATSTWRQLYLAPALPRASSTSRPRHLAPALPGTTFTLRQLCLAPAVPGASSTWRQLYRAPALPGATSRRELYLAPALARASSTLRQLYLAPALPGASSALRAPPLGRATVAAGSVYNACARSREASGRQTSTTAGFLVAPRGRRPAISWCLGVRMRHQRRSARPEIDRAPQGPASPG